jgi:hypothetical protein
LNDAMKLSRQQRRALERKVERQARMSDRALSSRGVVMVPAEELEALHSMQRFFVAIVKEQGRVRVTKATLDSLREGDSVKRADVPEGLMLTFKSGAPPEEGSEA